MTTTTPFEPIGDTPRWRIVLDLLEPLDVDDVLTYEQLNEALDVVDFRANRSPLYKAARVWGAARMRALEPVANIGYRVVEAREHEALARRQHLKSRRALSRGRTLLRNADRSRLPPEDVARFDSMEHTLARHEDMIRRLDARQEKTDRILHETRQTGAATEARVAELEEKLRRHGLGD